jgi:hypothetical protein
MATNFENEYTMNSLFQSYMNGNDVPHNLSIEICLFEKATDLGDTQPMVYSVEYYELNNTQITDVVHKLLLL